MEDDVKYRRAKARVEEIRGFYIHLTVYLMVNLGLFLINLATSPHTWWFYWPLLGWGIGVLSHGIAIFGLGGYLGKDWEDRKIKEIMEKENPT